MVELRSIRKQVDPAPALPADTGGGRFPVDDFHMSSFVWWTVHDAWRAGDPTVFDRVVVDHALAARDEALPRDYREYATMHVLHAAVLGEAKELVAERIGFGQGFSVAEADAVMEEASMLRRPLAQLKPLAASFCSSSLPQLLNYAENDEVPGDVQLATLVLIESAEASRRHQAGARQTGPGAPGMAGAAQS